MITNTSIIVRNNKTAWQTVEDKIIAVTPQNKRIHILSGAGAVIWQSLQEPKSIAQLVDSIRDEFEVERQQAERDAQEFVQELLNKEIVSLKNNI